MIENESAEDYLEAVLRLTSRGKPVHGVDVARELGVSKPAVTKAMRILTGKGYVSIVDNHIFLTQSGDEYARAVYAKHRLLTQFLVKLGVDEAEVKNEASFANDLGADSLDTVELIMEFEKEFQIQIPDDQAEKISTVGDAIAYIEANVKQ